MKKLIEFIWVICLPVVCMGINVGTAFEYDASNGREPALSQIDNTHYLCAYQGQGQDGFVVVLTVNTANWTITKGNALEYSPGNGWTPALSQIDATHYLCAYRGTSFDGFAVVLTVNTTNWTITKGNALEYDNSNGETPALSKIDDTHYLCAYDGPGRDGFAVVLTVNTTNWTITKGNALEYDNSNGETPALSKINDTHYLCAYAGGGEDGWAVVLTVNTTNWTISKGTAFEYDASDGKEPALSQIDGTHYLCAYMGVDKDGFAVVLTVNTTDWTITKGTAFEYDIHNNVNLSPALSKIDGTHYLCAYDGWANDGFAVVLTVNTADWTISKGNALEYTPLDGETPALSKIDDTHYLSAYAGGGEDGWAVVLTLEPFAVELVSFDAIGHDNYIQLTWMTECEINNSHWIVERSLNDSNYIERATLLAEGGPNTYNWIDTLAVNGMTYWYRLGDVDESGKIEWHGPMQVKARGKIYKFGLHQSYPNPFINSTTVKYSMPGKAGEFGTPLPVELKVYDITGKLVRTLVNEKKNPGCYTVPWDGSDSDGNKVSNGIYFYRLQVGKYIATKKTLLLK